MEYNTTRKPVPMLEYGRGIAEMADFLLTIQDSQQCRRQAELVIDAMAALNPGVKALDDYRQKLWDQLHLMTDLKLECDSPYPKPPQPEDAVQPEPPAYPSNKARRRQFGKHFDALLQRALDEKDEAKKQAFTQALGYYMKLAYTNWHKEQVEDEAIRTELERLTDGLLKYEPDGVHIPFMPLTTKGQQSGNRLSTKVVNAPGNGKSNGGYKSAGNGQKSYGTSRGRKFFKQRNK